MAGLLFAFMGNLMHNIKPNYFAGVRTPWTLEDPDTWRATHRLAGKLWFGGGIFVTIAVLVLPVESRADHFCIYDRFTGAHTRYVFLYLLQKTSA